MDTAVRRILAIRFRLGEFDPPERNPYTASTAEVVNCPEHQALAREAARRGDRAAEERRRLLPLTAPAPRVAVIGPLGDTLLEDWYSGTLPYAVTARAGLAERLGEDASVLRGRRPGRAARRRPGRARRRGADGAPLRARAADRPGRFDLFDWGGGVLRAARGRQPAGYVARRRRRRPGQRPARPERLGGAGDVPARSSAAAAPSSLRHLASGRYVAAGPGRRCSRWRTTREAATALHGRTRRGRRRGGRRGWRRDADVAVVVVGNHPLVNGRETEDRADLALPPGQDGAAPGGARGQPAHRAGADQQLPVRDRLGAASTCRRCCGRRTAARSTAPRWPTCCSATPTPAGRLTQTWYRSAAELPDLLDYDIIAHATRPTSTSAARPLYPFGHGLELHHASSTATCGCAPGRPRTATVTSASTSQHRRPRRAPRSCSSTPTSSVRGSSSRCAGCAASGGSGWRPARAATVDAHLPRRTSRSGTSPADRRCVETRRTAHGRPLLHRHPADRDPRRQRRADPARDRSTTSPLPASTSTAQSR